MFENKNCVHVVFSNIGCLKSTELSKLLPSETGVESGFHVFSDAGRAEVFAARVKKAGGQAIVLTMLVHDDEYADDWWCQCGFGPHGDQDDSCLKCGKRH